MLVMWHSRGAFLLALLTMGAVGTGTAAQDSPSPAPAVNSPYTSPDQEPAASPDLNTLRHMEADYVRAEMEDNATIAKAILADDYVGLKSDGSTTSKTDVLNNLAAGAQHRQPITITAINMREHLFGDTACVTYTKIYSRGNTGAAFRENVFHLYTRRNGHWRLQMSTPTPLPR